MNTELQTAYEFIMGAAYRGFSLSETYQLMWIDPDVYLTPGSFIQRWFASQMGVHHSKITEETVARHVYLFLNHKFGDFKGVMLVAPRGLPNVEGVDDQAATPARVTRGVLLELHMAPGVTYVEKGYYDPVTRERRIDTPAALITGDRDALEIDVTNSSYMSRVKTLRGKVARKCISIGEIGAETVGAFAAGSIPNQVQAEALTNEHVMRYVYRDTTGEIHENNYTGSEGPSLNEMYAEIFTLEAELRSPPEAVPAPEPSAETGGGAGG